MCRNCHDVREFRNSIVDVERDLPDLTSSPKAEASVNLEGRAE
tara:strand:- start:153 stop:281 length:129 start_codon:yes stop_codon:yes gene_type:complete